MAFRTSARCRTAATDLAFFEDLEPAADDFLADALAGLSQPQKTLPPKYFYDETGSRLFDAICETPEYYITRTELALLAETGPAIARLAGLNATVIEFGSGSSVKIRTLLDALDTPRGYTAIDISRDHLRRAASEIATDFPEVSVGAICADFTRPFALPDGASRAPGNRVGFLPGSTIGNFTPADATTFLAVARGLLGPGAALLIGVDLRKAASRLEAAYNDQAGHTAAFNRNVLVRMVRELGAELKPEGFEHRAVFNEAASRIEMHLVSNGAQEIRLAGRRFAFRPGETIHTENSCKYSIPEFQAVAARAGFIPAHVWADPDSLFSMHWLMVPD